MTPLPMSLWPLLQALTPTTAAKMALQDVQKRGWTLTTEQAQALLDADRYVARHLWPVLDEQARAHFADHAMKADYEREALEEHWAGIFADLKELRAADPATGAERTRQLYEQLWASENFHEKHNISGQIIGILWADTLTQDEALIFSDFPNKYLKALRGRFAGPIQDEWLGILKESIAYQRKRWRFEAFKPTETLLHCFFLGEMGNMFLSALTLTVILQTLDTTAEELLRDAQRSKQPFARIVEHFLKDELKSQRVFNFSPEEIGSIEQDDIKQYSLKIPSKKTPLLVERALRLIQEQASQTEAYWALSALVPKLEMDAQIKQPQPIPFVMPELPNKRWSERTVARWEKKQAEQHLKNQEVAERKWHEIMDTLRLRREWAAVLGAIQ